MNKKQRITRLENFTRIGKKKKYFCIIHPFNGTPEKFKACPQDEGDALTFETREALEGYFENRPDLELDLVEVVYVDSNGNEQNEN